MEPKKHNTVIKKKDNTIEKQDQNHSFSSEEDNLGNNNRDIGSTYILKYTRTEQDLKEISIETGQTKAKKCLIMINLKMISNPTNTESEKIEKSEKSEEEAPAPQEQYLAICCHEIAAVYFDEIYEKIYTLEDLKKENKYFRVFDKLEHVKLNIDYVLKHKESNMKKVFVSFENKQLKLHMKINFFNKEKEIVLTVPKKILTESEKINLLPEFLKEIQDKMSHLENENKQLKDKKGRLRQCYKLEEENIVINNRTVSVRPKAFLSEKNDDIISDGYISHKQMSNDTSDSTKNGNDKLNNSWKLMPEVENPESYSSNDNGGVIKFNPKKIRNKVKISRKMPEANFF